MLAAVDPLVDGWFHHGDQILRLLEQHRPRVCVELGTFQGKSAIPVARAIRRWRGTLTCVDTWCGLPSLMPLSPPWMIARCGENLRRAGVNSNVHLMVASTLEAAQSWRDPIDYLYIDADHSYEGVRADLEAWVPHMRPGGLLIGDDYGNTAYPGVKRAWDEFEVLHGLAFTLYDSTPPNLDGIQLIYGTV